MDNAEKALPEVWIVLGGEKKKLVAGFGTLLRFRLKTGKNPMLKSVWAESDPVDMVTLVWAALGGEACGKTVEEVADLMAVEHLEDVGQLMKALFNRASATEEQKKIAE